MSEKALVDYEAILAEEKKRIKEAVGGPSRNTISVKDKMFTMPSGESHKGPLSVVILDFRSYNAHYAGAYNPNNIQPPNCFAIGKYKNEMTPSKNAEAPQADACATCPKNEFGSDPGGGKGKACKNQYRIAVVAADFATKDPNEIEIMTITVSPTGLKGFDTYVNRLKAMYDALPVEYITEISFNPNATYSSLLFTAIEPHGHTAQMMQLRDQAVPMLETEPV